MRSGLRVDMLGAMLMALLAGGVAPADDGPVIDATKRGNVEEVRTLIAQGANVNEAYGDGMTALHWAAERGDLEVAKVLIAAGASVKAGTRIGYYTPLHMAAKAGRHEVVAALVEAGADVSAAATNSGATPLHLAAISGSVDVIRVLVQHGADVDRGDGAAGQTPLMIAAAYNRPAAIRALVEAHADPAVTSEVIDFAAQAERNEAMTHRFWELMVRFYDDGEKDMMGSAWPPPPNIMQAAIQASRQEDVTPPTEEEKEWLSDARQGRRGRSSRAGEGMVSGGMTALLHAARAGNEEAAMALLDVGADIDQTRADGTSPLLIALINGHNDLALRLIERGADPMLADDEAGVTPLYAVLNAKWYGKTFHVQPMAAEYQTATHYDVMQALLEAGADPNARLTKDIWYNFTRYNPVDHTGATPFWRAAHGLDVDAMKMLVAHGADPSVATIHKPCTGGYGCSNAGDENTVDKSGVPPAIEGGPGVYPIHMATGFAYGLTYTANEHRYVLDGWIPTVKYLIELGADVNARDHNAMTPLHNAAATGNNALVQLLVDHGADVRVKNRIGQTVVDMANAPHDRVQPYPETIKLLESLGAEKSDVPPPCIARGACD